MLKSKIRRQLLLPAALTILASHSLAASPALDRFMVCAGIESHIDRLECYDQAARAAVSPSGNAIESSQIPREELSVRESLPVTPVPATRNAEVHTPQPKTNAAPPLPRDLGAPPPRVTKEEKEGFNVEILKVEKLSRGNYRLTLSGGQVWQEIEQDPKTRYAVGDEVVLRRGLFGSYNLTSTKTKRRAKVRRLDVNE